MSMDDDNLRFLWGRLGGCTSISSRYIPAAGSLALPVPWKNSLGSASRCDTPA